MNQYYVIGNPVQHSLSPEIFSTLFRTHHIDANYKAFLANDEQAFTELISKKNLFKGANITAPFKKTAYSAVDQLDASARHNKSVNCIKIINSTRVGFNTDEYCFNKMIEYNNLSLNNQNILILGTGGIVRTIINCINSKFQSNIYIFGVHRIETPRVCVAAKLKAATLPSVRAPSRLREVNCVGVE